MTHLVDFEKYCKACKYKHVDELDQPCSDCIAVPSREDSRRPTNYEEEGGESDDREIEVR